ncbi:MAG: site-specific integrase [Clostridia bacterium]|nr:site-specific integrase [Clostridia bacterium]
MPIYKTDKKNKEGKQQYRVCVNYTDTHGKYRQKTKLVYGSAEAKLVEMELAKSVEQKEVTSNITVEQLYSKYIDTHKHEVREATIQKIEDIMQRFVIPSLGKYSLTKLTVPVLSDWKNEIAAGDYKARYKQNIYSTFRAVLNFGVKMELIPKNPLTIVGNFKDNSFEKPQDKLHYYTVEQFKSFIAEAKKDCRCLNDWGYYVFFNIAFYTGMRKGEINALKWSDIEGNIIHIRRSVAQKVKNKPIVETLPKNKSSYRDVQIPSVLRLILDEHYARHKAQRGFTEDYRVCGGIACLGDTSISNKNIKFATAAGLEPIRIHDFRHSHASVLVNNGINIQEVARRLGHSKVEMTWNTYSHLYPKEEERAVEILENL